MNLIKHILFVFSLLLLTMVACKNIPDFPLQPSISNAKISVSKIGNNVNGLKLAIDFTDGDGDLGLNSNDTLPPYSPQYNQLNIPTNPNYNNIFIKFLIKDVDDVFKECEQIPSCNELVINSIYTISFTGIDSVRSKYTYTYRKPNTSIDTAVTRDTIYLNPVTKIKDSTIAESFSLILKRYNGRFPFLGPDSKKGPISGTLNYDIATLGFPRYMTNKTLQLKVKIKDKALNESNELTTDSLSFK